MSSRPNTDGRDDRLNDAGRALASSLLGDVAPAVRPARPVVAPPSSPNAVPGSRQARRAARERIVAHDAPAAPRTVRAAHQPAPSADPDDTPRAEPDPDPEATQLLGRRERRLLREEQERQALAREEAREAERQEARDAERQRQSAVPPPDAPSGLEPVDGPGLRARARQRRTQTGDEPPARQQPQVHHATTPEPEPVRPRSTPAAPRQRVAPRPAPPRRSANATQAAALAPGAFDYLPWLREDRVDPDGGNDDDTPTRFVRLRAAPAPPRPAPRPDRPDPRVRELVVASPEVVRPTSGSSAEPRPVDDDAAEPDEASPRARRVRAAIEWTMVLGTAAIVALVLQRFVVQLYEIPSESMYPTLQKADRVAVSKLAYDIGGGVERGDVIVFKRPEAARSDDPEQPAQLIKRVIGLPGDVVEARGGVVYVDGSALRETGPDQYLGSDVVTNNLAQPVTVPPDHVFVMGDNREHSFDSRFFGAIPTDDIIGRAVAVAWPTDRWETL